MPLKQDLQPSWILRCFTAVFFVGETWLHFIQGKTHYRGILEHMVTVGPGSMYSVLLINLFAWMILLFKQQGN
ncbi:MAG: hypothetical protein HRU34_12075 [Richelia sp.]|nr:hypothetical protein [Richelia sp.]CDN13828.1 hypothetical protein RintRC_0991 [Richelia intracellularis]